MGYYTKFTNHAFVLRALYIYTVGKIGNTGNIFTLHQH